MDQQPRRKGILIAGVGNRLRGDDGFGPRVIDLLSSLKLPKNVDFRDLGTAGITIATELSDYRVVIFVDAMRQGNKPGTLYKTGIDVKDVGREEIVNLVSLSLHEARLEGLLTFAKAIGALPPKVFVIGCEPKSLDGSLELSHEVEKATKEAVNIILNELELEELLKNDLD